MKRAVQQFDQFRSYRTERRAYNAEHEIGKWMLGPGTGCRGSRVFATVANGCPAFAQYRPAADGFDPWSLTVLETSGDRIVAVYNFLYPELFPAFGFPLHLEH